MAAIRFDHFITFTVVRSIQEQDMLLVEPDLRDGATFLVQQRPMTLWLQERVACTGEQFTLID